jgi:hypothetical protein
LRRIVLIATALGVLVAAGAVYAATSNQINTYQASLKVAKVKGTPSKPVPVGYTQDIKATGTNGNRTAVLLDIKTKIFGLKESGAKGAGVTCTLQQISAAHAKGDAVCPKASQVASGFITAVLGMKNDFKAAGSACDPLLHVYNSGPGKLTFFFVDQGPKHLCLNGIVKTGSVGPYPATYKQQGKFLVVDVPVPPYVSFPAGLAGSLVTEHLVWKKMSFKSNGKSVPSLASVGCQGSKRPNSATFTATLPAPSGTGTPQSATVSNSSAC